MKTKSKILFALAFLTAGTIAAASTSTFAWFTTTRTANLAFENVTVQKTTSNLVAKLYPLSASAWGASGDTTLSNAVNISEISSGDGVNFIKPIWEKEVDGNIKGHTAGTAGKDYTYFLLEVENSGATGAPALDVYFDAGTQIKPHSAGTKADECAALYSRVAVNHFGTAKPAANLAPGTTKLIFENASATINSSTVNATIGKYVSYSSPNYDKKATIVEDNLITGAFSAVTYETRVAKQAIVTNLAVGSKAYSIVSVWLEGTKGNGDNFNAAAGGVIDINLKLSAFDYKAVA